MKFIIAQSTVTSLSVAGCEVINALEIGHETPMDATEVFKPCDRYANHSVSHIGDDIVLEVNDELFFKYMAVYLKVAKFVGPFIKPAMALLHVLKSDVAEIERWANTRK